MVQVHANLCAKTNAKTYAIHEGSTSWIHKVQRTVASNQRTQNENAKKHRQPIKHTIPTRTLHKTQGYAHQKLQAQQKHNIAPMHAQKCNPT